MSDVPNKHARPPRGLVGDIHRARQGATATAAELREFVRELRGRSPQEMLGMVAGSNLVRGTVLASIVTLIFMTAFTVGPYAWKRMSPPKVSKKPVAAAPATAAPAAASPANVPPTSAPNAAVASSALGAPATGAAPNLGTPATGPASPDAIGKLGIGDTKVADPKKNPLDNSTDDLLKDLK